MSDLPIDVDAEAIFLDGGWFTREDLSRRIKAMLDAGDFNVAKPSAALEQLTSTISTVRTLMFRSTPDLAEGLNQVAARTGQSVGAVIREAVTQYLTDQGIAATSAGPVGAQKPAPKPSAPSGALSPASPPSNAQPLTTRASPPVTPSAPVAPAPVIAYPVPSSHSSGVHAAPVPPPLPATPANSFSSLPLVVDIEEDETPQQQEPTVRRAMPIAPPGHSQDDLPKVIVEEQPMVIAGPGALANAGVPARPIELTQKKP